MAQALASATLLWAALPPLDLWPLAWIAPLFWLRLIARRELPGRRPYRAIWLAGFCFWLAAYHWVRLSHWSAYFGWVALAFYLAFYLPTFIGLARIAVHRLRVPLILAAPVVWTGLELARGHLLTGITMGDLGHTQYRWIGLIQISDLAGAYGVSFVVMLVAACLARMLPGEEHRWALWPLGPAAATMAVVLGYGYLRPADPPAPATLRVALIQGSIDTELKFDPDPKSRYEVFEQYLGLSMRAVRQGSQSGGPVDLVVWPETMLREPLITYDPDLPKPDSFDGSPAEFREWLEGWARRGPDAIAVVAESLGVPLILGIDREHIGRDDTECYNSGVYVHGDGRILGIYDKMHPVMFGERLPFVDLLPWLKRWAPLGQLTPGESPVAFRVGDVVLAPNICYETVLPHVIRRQVNELKRQGDEPDALVNLTNDGWFWGSSELDMHLACGVFRAVECRKPLLIAANTGFSAWIDADGRILDRGPRRDTSVVFADVGPQRRGSFYLDHGDWPAGVCLAACIGVALFGLVARTRLAVRPLKNRQ